MNLGEKIGELRKSKGITQERLAEKIGVTRQTVSNWEGNVTVPDIGQALLLAKFFKISLDDLTNNNLNVKCYKRMVLEKLVGQKCLIDLDDECCEIPDKECLVMEVMQDFVKIQVQKKKLVEEKLIDMRLVSSFKILGERKRK